MTGVAGRALNVDTVEEIQVKSSGYAAEYGGSTGGVVNVITRSGTNDWHGDARLYFSGDALDAAPRPVLQRNALDSSKAEYATYAEDQYASWQPGVSVGGPIHRDVAWFYVAYQPVLVHTERAVTFALDGSTATFQEDRTQHLLTASQTLQLGSRLRTRLAVNDAPRRTEGLLPNLAGSDSPVSNFDVNKDEPNWTLSGVADFVATPRLLLSGRLGYTFADTRTSNVRDVPRYGFVYSNIGLLDVPNELQRVTLFLTDTNNYDYLKDRVSRLSTQMDATVYLNTWGDHALKGGIQADWTTNDSDKGYKRNNVLLFWNRALLGKRGKYGYYFVQSNPIDPARGQIFLGRARGSTAGLFIQDNWRVGQRLTINA